MATTAPPIAGLDRPHAPPPAPPPPVAAPARRRRPRWRRRVRAAAIGAAVAGGVAVGFEPAVGLVAVATLLVPLERLFRRHPYRFRRPGLATDLTWALLQPASQLVGVVVAAAVGIASVATWAPALALRPVVTALPAAVQVGLGLVLFDLVAYWVHRLNHEIPLLWRFHRIHHSSGQLDWISGIRAHPLDGVVAGVPFVALFAAGFTGATVGVVAALQAVAGLLAHANVRWRLRPLQRLVQTPEFHHWHHADEPDAHDTNYGAFLTLWDQLFGTYRVPCDQRPQRYGVAGPVPDGVLGQLLAPFRRPAGAGVPGRPGARP